ncbi:hypothetical protein PENSPDRAFT_395620 [Peniophora sp. CONT]|nr:hypothetical protein PENSPDRAFT_395620 [Peniophora sp. CONT]
MYWDFCRSPLLAIVCSCVIVVVYYSCERKVDPVVAFVVPTACPGDFCCYYLLSQPQPGLPEQPLVEPLCERGTFKPENPGFSDQALRSLAALLRLVRPPG